jgi:hypothetical protein
VFRKAFVGRAFVRGTRMEEVSSARSRRGEANLLGNALGDFSGHWGFVRCRDRSSPVQADVALVSAGFSSRGRFAAADDQGAAATAASHGILPLLFPQPRSRHRRFAPLRVERFILVRCVPRFGRDLSFSLYRGFRGVPLRIWFGFLPPFVCVRVRFPSSESLFALALGCRRAKKKTRPFRWEISLRFSESRRQVVLARSPSIPCGFGISVGLRFCGGGRC